MFFILALINGGLTAVSRTVNAALGARVGSLRGSLVNHLVGALAAGLLVALGLGAGSLRVARVPLVYLTGGCAGVLVVAASNYAVAHLGVTLVSMITLAFQLVSSALIDHYGLLGAPRLPLTWQRGIGLFLVVAGALVALSASPEDEPADEAAQAREATRGA